MSHTRRKATRGKPKLQAPNEPGKKEPLNHIFYAVYDFGEFSTDGMVDFKAENLNKVSQCYPLGKTGLYFSAQAGKVENVEWFLEQGNIDIYKSKQQSPLGAAAENGHLEIVKLLLAKHEEYMGTPPSNESEVKVVKDYLNEPNEAGESPLFIAAKHGQVDVVKYLLDQKGINPERPNKNGKTPLAKANDKAKKNK